MNSFFANPGSALQWAIPLYTSDGLRIRLTFWLILSMVFSIIDNLRFGNPLYFIPVDLALILIVLLFHEWGHRVFARMVGGNHWEWVLWPLGGMVAPTAPRRAGPMFVANVGGIVFTLILGGAAIAGLALVDWSAFHLSLPGILSPSLMIRANFVLDAGLLLLLHALAVIVGLSIELFMINLFPCYWFDGGYLWQCVLWPMMGLYQAINITCIAGMVLAAPLFLLSLFSRNFFGMIFWIFIFSACFTKRRELKMAGPGIVPGEDEAEYAYMDPAPVRKKGKKRWFKAAAKRAAKERAEQAQIDAILAKVHDKGLHSLTWFEKRALKRATERQRQRDLAERL
jgi:hypothetical protein